MNLWKTISVALLALFLLFNFAYRIGGDGVHINGSDLDFRRGHDFQLYRVDARNAVLVHESDRAAQELAIVRVAAAPFPLSFLCGRFSPDGFTDEYDEIRANKSLQGRVVLRTPHPTPGQRDRVLVAMRPAEAHALLQPLSTCNESCVTFNIAFVILFGVALLALPIVLLHERRASG